MNIRRGTTYSLGTVAAGRVTRWQDYEIEKVKDVWDDGSTQEYYQLYIDGDFETDCKTLKAAKDYVKDLQDSWLENHPGEKI